ncbi:hypothetical protein N9F23_00215 [Candidatus Pelagibacter sp.]|nr:hypothetical protein [Candidatus Pelagibacter sp.]
MTFKLNKDLPLSEKDIKRTKRIISKLNLKKIPFKITEEQFCSSYTEMFMEIMPLFRYQPHEYAMKWCLSTEKRMRVFLLIFKANELGEEIYKESISSKLPEYSYKTIAQIIDDGIEKGYFIKLAPRAKASTDAKIRNIRPSEELVIEFVNWNIDLLSTFSNFSKKFS